MRNPFKKEKTVTIDEIDARFEKHMETLRKEIRKIILDQQDYYKMTETERIEREDVMESSRVEREIETAAKALEFEGYINNSMREVSEQLVELLNKTDEPVPQTSFKKPRFWH